MRVTNREGTDEPRRHSAFTEEFYMDCIGRGTDCTLAFATAGRLLALGFGCNDPLDSARIRSGRTFTRPTPSSKRAAPPPRQIRSNERYSYASTAEVF